MRGNIIYDGLYGLLENGLIEILLFAFIFVVVYGLLRNVGLFVSAGKKPSGDNADELKEYIKNKAKKLESVKKIHAIIALVVASLSILPSFYAPWSEYNIVPAIRNSLPQISLLIVGLLVSMIFLGMVGIKIVGNRGNPIKLLIFVGLIVFVSWVFISESGLRFMSLRISGEIMAITVAVVVFGLIVSYVMGPSDKKKEFSEIFGSGFDFSKEDSKELVKKWNKVNSKGKLNDLFKKI